MDFTQDKISLVMEVDAPTMVMRVPQPVSFELEAASPASKLQMMQTGPRGEKGETGFWEVNEAFQLKQLSLPITSGAVTIDFTTANTYFILLTEDVTTINFANIPAPGVSVRLQLYVQQDAIGGRVFEGWPASVNTAGGAGLSVGPDPNERDCFVLDTFEGATRVHVNLVGQDYRPISG